MWPASTASPSEMSSIACAVARAPPFGEAQRRTRRSGARRKRGAGGAERAGDDERVAGPRASAARNAFRAPERGHAESTISEPASCRRRRPARPARRCPRRARARRRARSPCGSAEGDDQRLRLGAGRGEVAQVDGGGAEAEVAPGEPVEPEVDALDERVLRDDEPVAELGGVVLDPAGRGRAARARRAGRAHRAARASSTASASRRSPRSADDRDPGCAGRETVGALVASIPPIATTGIETASQISARPSSPIGGSASGFVGVAQTGPAPMYAAPALSPARPPRRSSAEAPSTGRPRAPARAPSSSRPRWTPSAPSAIAASTSSLTTKVAGSSPEADGPLVDELLGRRALQPQLEDGCAAFDGDCGRLEVGDDSVQPHPSATRAPRRSSRVEVVERVVEARVERPRALRALGGILARDAEGDQGLRRCLERRVRRDREEAAGDRGRHAARAGDGAEQLVAVRDRDHALAVGDVVDRRPSRRRHSRASRPPRCASSGQSRPRRSTRRRGSPPAAPRASRPRPRCRARPRPRPRRGCASPSRCGSFVAPAPTGSSTTGTPRAFAAARREQHRLDPVLRQRADVEHERPGDRRHLLDLLARVRHHRQRAERKRRVRGLVHDDVVRDLVDERLALAQRGASPASSSRALMPRTSTGPSPAPISTSPFRTASEATRAAPRAASSRDSPFASSAASVAEWVQPAPWVAATSCRSTGISMCRRRRRGGRPASSPCPPVTITAARSELVDSLGQLTPRPGPSRRAPRPRAGSA